jgi:hypothetical protein
MYSFEVQLQSIHIHAVIHPSIHHPSIHPSVISMDRWPLVALEKKEALQTRRTRRTRPGQAGASQPASQPNSANSPGNRSLSLPGCRKFLNYGCSLPGRR